MDFHFPLLHLPWASGCDREGGWFGVEGLWTSEAVLYAKGLDSGSLMCGPESAIEPVISELSFMGCFIIRIRFLKAGA